MLAFRSLADARLSLRPTFSTTETQLYLAHVYSNGIQLFRRYSVPVLPFSGLPAMGCAGFQSFGL